MATKKLVLTSILASLCLLASGLLAGDGETGKGMESVPNEVQRMVLEHMSSKQRKGVARVSKVWAYLDKTFPGDFPEKWEVDTTDKTIHMPLVGEIEATRTLEENPSKTFMVALESPLSNYAVLDRDNVRFIFCRVKNFNKEALKLLQLALNKKNKWWGLVLDNERKDMTEEHIEFLSPLINNLNFVALKINDFKISLEQLKQILELLKNKRLHLDVSHCNLGTLRETESHVEKREILSNWLADNPHVVSLNFQQDDLSYLDMVSLARGLEKNEVLTYFGLVDSTITPEGMAYIINAVNRNVNSNIIQLNFAGNSLRGDIKMFANALQKNTKVTSLNFSSCDFSVLNIYTLIEALKNNTTLTEINLEKARISDAAKKEIEEIVERNRKNKMME